MSIHKIYQYSSIKNTESSSKLQQEAQFLTSCTYEKNTLWGEQARVAWSIPGFLFCFKSLWIINLCILFMFWKQIGFLYHSVVEDYFTGFILHCKGKTSVFCNPSKPAFLGSSTTNLNDLLVQGTRWNSGLFEVTLSKFCPFIYGLSRMPLLQTMCYGYLAFQPLYFLPLWCLATLPQLCLLNGIPIYPQVRIPTPLSSILVLHFKFLSSALSRFDSSSHLHEILYWRRMLWEIGDHIKVSGGVTLLAFHHWLWKQCNGRPVFLHFWVKYSCFAGSRGVVRRQRN